VKERSNSDLGRIAREVLGDVEVFSLSEGGPNGPWTYRWLVVTRRGVRIYVMDVDGKSQATIDVTNLPDGDEAVSALPQRLDEINESIRL